MSKKVRLAKPVVVSHVNNGRLRSAVLSFITVQYQCYFGTTPQLVPEFLFAAQCDDQIVGTISLDFADKARSLPMEDIYDFSRARTPWPLEMEKVAQYSRWLVVQKGISRALLYTAATYALCHNKIYALCEIRDVVADRLRAMGVDLRPISGAKLLLDKVNLEDRPYYLTEAPHPYMFLFKQMEEALQEKVRAAITDGRIVIKRSNT